jgi:uncharacterized damage-inducible protein DinB
MTHMQTTVGPREAWTYAGARALVHLHEVELRRFMGVWQQAKSAGVCMPAGSDAHAASLDTLLFHVLRAAGAYMAGLCQWLDLPAPDLPTPPVLEHVADEGAQHLDDLLAVWRTTLTGVTEEQVERTTGETPWGVTYCVDALLEHAVMHPMRHSLQLEQLLAED